ncbi:MAG: NAD(P)H-binding protein [Pseudomonadota bacterium]
MSDETEHKNILVLGASGTIGRAVVRALLDKGHSVTCFLREKSGPKRAQRRGRVLKLFSGATVRFGNVTNKASLMQKGICGDNFDVIISCVASRNGNPRDAWLVDCDANLNAIEAARETDVSHFILLSAICVQKPLLQFQHAKLAAEKALTRSGLTYTIVRPTAFFKSLSGQIARLKRGKSFLLFGDGALTACKPISDNDLADYLASCIENVSLHNKILPIGGPGPAISPREQGDYLFELLRLKPKFSKIPVSLISTIIWTLDKLGRIVPSLSDKAELARIARYYATESMLVLDPETGEYDADKTPSAGSEMLFDYYRKVVCGEATVESGDHTVFDP